MLLTTAHLLAVIAIFPFIYLLIALYSSWHFFSHPDEPSTATDFTPPVSTLKPVRGLDPEAYENFASFCKQDYPEYEIVFCVDGVNDPVLPVIERLQHEFPERAIRVLYGSGRIATNDKVAKLGRLVSEAKYEYLVISDSDVRVPPNYLRKTIAPFASPKIGAVTCLYVSTEDNNLVEKLQSVGMLSDFYAGLFVAKQLDGVKFALGQTIATKRTRLAEFGGYQTLENRPADDLLVGRLIADQGYEIKLSQHAVETVADYRSLGDLLRKRLRWLVVMRHMRPWGHLGLIFTNALPWVILIVALRPSMRIGAGFVAAYIVFRIWLSWLIGVWGFKRTDLWRKLWLIPAWDAVAFCIWLASFARNTVTWRGGQYYIRKGILIQAASPSPTD